MNHPEYQAMEARNRYQDILADAEQERLAAMANQERFPLLRQTARVCGRALIRVGARLMRYSRTERVASYPRVTELAQ